MERLTKRDIDGCLIHPWSFNGINGSYDIWDEELMEKQIDRLAAYEDTGLEPEEIKVHEAAKYNAGYYHGDEDRCRWIEKELGPIDHLRDLVQAEQDGLLVMLPCGTDAELVRDGHTFKADHWNHTLTSFRDAPENKSGKQVALFSIKEAEAALALKGGEG